MKIVTVIGTRPQFIKASAFSRALQACPEIQEVIVHTGQHFDVNMSDIFFQELSIPKAHYSLNVGSLSHGQMTGRMLEGIESILVHEKPDAVLVYGDTNSTLAGALAASKLHIPIIHIEAGLRSFNKKMPEEINRVLTDHMASYLFCPTQTAVNNLKQEGIEGGVYHVGDIMYDVSLHSREYMKNISNIQCKFSYLPDQFIFMTIHRAESTRNKNKFREIIVYALDYARKNKLKIVFPIHPRIRSLIEQETLDGTFVLLDPLSYLETQYCLSKSRIILTDSGGLQKEAYFHKVPCVTLRSETEWTETVTHGWNRLWSVDRYAERKNIDEYGEGDSAEKIVAAIMEARL